MFFFESLENVARFGIVAFHKRDLGKIKARRKKLRIKFQRFNAQVATLFEATFLDSDRAPDIQGGRRRRVYGVSLVNESNRRGKIALAEAAHRIAQQFRIVGRIRPQWILDGVQRAGENKSGNECEQAGTHGEFLQVASFLLNARRMQQEFATPQESRAS
jgi:hypothetical protein